MMEGEQGIGKSTALSILGGEWFSDSLPGDLRMKDAALHLFGKWIIELAELCQIHRSEVEIVKAFLTRTDERFRPPYGENEISYPRQCVFAGTTNQTAYLKDETGDRRIWPVKVNKVDVDGLRRDRDQLWGEAQVEFEAGECWHLDDENLRCLAGSEQAERYDEDPWEEPIRVYVEGLPKVTVGIILDHIYGNSCEFSEFGSRLSKHTRGDQNRVTKILTRLGWERGRKTSSARVWVKAGAQNFLARALGQP